MPIDIRAEVSCSLGTVISGSFADDYLQGNGLIKTRGEVVLAGTQTPVVGTQVTFTYDKGGTTYTVPRVLRVLSSFADPFRRTTTVQLGCKLTYLENRKPPVQNPNSKDENADVPCKVFLQATLPISAEYVFQQCLDALGLDSASIPLTNKFSVEEFDLMPGYVQVMSDLLQSEGYAGYLDSEETLQFLDLTEAASAGPVITPADVVDLGPIGSGDLPGESVVVRWSNLRLLPPDQLYGDQYLKRSWEIDEVFGAPTDVSVSYVNDEGSTISDTDIFFPYSFSAIRYDVWNRKIESISLNLVSSAEVNNRWASDAFRNGGTSWNVPTGKLTHEVIEYELPASAANNVDLLSVQQVGGGPTVIKSLLRGAANGHNTTANLCKTEVPDGADVVKSQTTFTYISELELAGALNIDTYLEDSSIPGFPGDLVIFDTIAAELESRVVVEYETDTASGVSKTLTKRFVSRSQTVSGQQDLASRIAEIDASNIDDSLQIRIDKLLREARVFSYIGAEVGLHTQREYGLQKRPSEAERNNTANSKPQISESKAEITWIVGSTTSTAVTEFTLPYAPDDAISWNETTGEFSSTPSDADQKAMRYGRVQNALLLGNRNGVSLQLAPDQLPKRPFDPLYLQAGGITGAYRVNGTSWAFDANGIVASTDALLWGAVSAASGTNLASSWVPLAPGTTSLPLPYTPSPGGTDSETGVSYSAVITPAVVLAPYLESVKVEGISRSTVALTDYPYTLDRGTETQVAVTKSKVLVGSKLTAAATSYALAGQAAGSTYSRKLSAAAGSFTSTGYSAGSVRSYGIGTNAGTFAFSGQDAALKRVLAPLAAQAGSFTLTGQNATSSGATTLTAAVGAYNFSGQAAGKLQGLIMPADARSFAATGQDAALNYISPVFSIVSYTGNATARSITGVGFQPSMVWINNLAGSLIHDLTIFDQRRGTGRFIRTIADGQEYVDAQTLTSFDSDGFSLGTSTTTNSSGASRFYEAFCWKGLGPANTNTSGTITSTTQVSSAAGFGIFTYSGNSTANATVGHGLGSAPEWVFIQSRTSGFSNSGQCHSSLLSGGRVWQLTSTAAAGSSTQYIRAVGTSTLTLSSDNAVNNSSLTYVGYAFTSVPGVSKLGLATGDGTGVLSINVGFCPKMLIIKTYIGTGDWLLCRRTNNTTGYVTQTSMNLSTASTVSTQIQITSTGFSIDSGGDGNVSGSTESIWYMAYA